MFDGIQLNLSIVRCVSYSRPNYRGTFEIQTQYEFYKHLNIITLFDMLRDSCILCHRLKKTIMVWTVYEFTGIHGTGIASIFALAAISLGDNVRHRLSTEQNRNLLCLHISYCRTMDADINIHFYKVTALPLSIITTESFMCTLALFHSTPLLVMCIVYFVVWK